MSRARARIIFGCVALVLGVAAWIVLGPTALGGGVTYATTFGNSMEPKLHRGDLVMLRASPPYHVGDVVGYQDPTLNRLVLHRIIGGTEAGFTMKGDNNNFVDPTRPRGEDIVGRFVTSVPNAGSVIARFKGPGSAALLVGALALWPVGSRRRRRRGGGGAPSASPARAADTRRTTLAALVVLALALAALAGYAYSRPTSETLAVTDAYEQTGTFAYRAAATRGAAYPGGVVRTGEAVFTRLSRRVEVSFDYRLASDRPTAVGGIGSLEAVVSDGAGWSRTVPLGPPATFRDRVELTGTLRLDRLRAMMRAFERETGTKGSDYSITVTPRLSVAGTVGGSQIDGGFAPSLPLRLDASRLTIATSPTGEAPSLTSRRSGNITEQAPASISLGGLSLPVFRARAIGLLGFEAVLGAVLLLGLPLLMQARSSEAAAIRMRMGGRLVDVSELPWSAPGGCVDLERMSDLARVAEGADVPIMVVEREGAARYAVVRGEVLYRYATRSSSRAGGPAQAAVVA